MPPTRQSPSPRNAIRYSPVLRKLKGLFCAPGMVTPGFKSVPTLSQPCGPERFPCIESVLGPSVPIHECTVQVYDGAGDVHQFLVCCQVGADLLPNLGMRDLLPPHLPAWHGAILLIKMGQISKFISLTGRDRDLAAAALTQFFYSCTFDLEGEGKLVLPICL